MEKNFENAVTGLIIGSLIMLTLFIGHDMEKYRNAKPEIVTVTEYVEVEVEKDCKQCIERVSRGGDVEIPEEEPVVYDYIPSHNIQPIDWNFDVMTPSNFTVEELSKSLSNGPHQGLLHLASTFIEAEQTYGVNALYLMSTIGWESGWGRYRANTNNLAGWTRTDGPGFRAFDSEYECVMTVASGISSFYKNSVGTSLGAVTQKYCPDPGYTNNIITIMQEQQYKILNY